MIDKMTESPNTERRQRKAEDLLTLIGPGENRSPSQAFNHSTFQRIESHPMKDGLGSGSVRALSAEARRADGVFSSASGGAT